MNPDRDDILPELTPADDAIVDATLSYLAGEMSDEQVAQFNASLQGNEHGRRIVAAVIWHRRMMIESLRGQTQDDAANLTLTGAASPADASATDASSSTAQTGRVWRWSLRHSMSAAALAAAIAVAVTIWFALQTNKPTQPPTRAAATVATVTGLDDATLSELSMPMSPGGSLAPGVIDLESGQAHLMFNSTAAVDLVGRCRFEMTGPNRGRLMAGTLNAFVPTQAHGFTVDLPNRLEVVDLGTAFTATVHDDGSALVVINTGSIRIEQRDADDRITRTWNLTADNASGDGSTYLDLPAASGPIVRFLPVVNPSFEMTPFRQRTAPIGWQRNRDNGIGEMTRGPANDLQNHGLDGRSVAIINADYPVAGQTDKPTLYQDLDARFVAGATYTLHVLVARRADYDTTYRELGPTRWRIAIGSGDHELAAQAGAIRVGEGGVMIDKTLTYTATEKDAGKPIRISLINDAAADTPAEPAGSPTRYPGQARFDLVRLTQTNPPAQQHP